MLSQTLKTISALLTQCNILCFNNKTNIKKTYAFKFNNFANDAKI